MNQQQAPPLTEIVTTEDKRLTVTKFISYGFDVKCFAVVGNDLYFREGNQYRLLLKNFYKPKKLIYRNLIGEWK